MVSVVHCCYHWFHNDTAGVAMGYTSTFGLPFQSFYVRNSQKARYALTIRLQTSDPAVSHFLIQTNQQGGSTPPLSFLTVSSSCPSLPLSALFPPFIPPSSLFFPLSSFPSSFNPCTPSSSSSRHDCVSTHTYGLCWGSYK